MRGKRPLRRAIRQAKRLANLTGMPYRVRRENELGTYQVHTPRDTLAVTQKPPYRMSRAKRTFGRLYVARSHKQSTLAGPYGIMVYPGKSDAFSCPKPGKVVWKCRRDQKGRFAKYGSIWQYRAR